LFQSTPRLTVFSIEGRIFEQELTEIANNQPPTDLGTNDTTHTKFESPIPPNSIASYPPKPYRQDCPHYTVGLECQKPWHYAVSRGELLKRQAAFCSTYQEVFLLPAISSPNDPKGCAPWIPPEDIEGTH
jgi:hypothetical protein